MYRKCKLIVPGFNCTNNDEWLSFLPATVFFSCHTLHLIIIIIIIIAAFIIIIVIIIISDSIIITIVIGISSSSIRVFCFQLSKQCFIYHGKFNNQNLSILKCGMETQWQAPRHQLQN